MEVYHDYAHCFVCGAHCKVEELEGDIVPRKAKKKSNIAEWVHYTEGLMTKWIRGIHLPYDSKGYYIVWPDKSYYKRRNWTGEPRYTAPTGHKQPLLTYQSSHKKLVVIEGELNCMSVSPYTLGKQDFTLCSPGPASDFMRHIKTFLQYREIVLIMDHDPAGIAFGVQVKDLLLKSGRHAKLVTRTEDYNDVLQKTDASVLKYFFEKDIE